MKAYKAFNQDMTCRGFQYAEGGDYELPEGQKAKLCERGFHACERAVDVLQHYNAGSSVVHEVEVDGVDPKRDTDSKVCGRKIHIGARLNVAHLVQATFEYNREHCTTEHTDPKQASAGLRGAASAGAYGAASAGAYGAALAQGNGCRVRGGLGSILVIGEEAGDSFDIVAWHAVLVDGATVKADTWYTIVDGELVEADDQETEGEDQ